MSIQVTAKTAAKGIGPVAATGTRAASFTRLKRGIGASYADCVVWLQQRITLPARARGFHLITRHVIEELDGLDRIGVGVLHLLIQHTSASLALNENASPDVLRDFETFMTAAIPENFPGWTHTLEGPDDMPAHVKAALLGPSLTIPLRGGVPALGTWQGIYLCEHRDHGGPRSIVATAWGEGR